MRWHFLEADSLFTAGLLLTWLIQSTVLLAGGLLAGRLVRRRGPAVQSALYRTTLTAVILCPIASLTMNALGFSGLLIRLPGLSENAGDVFASRQLGPNILPLIASEDARSVPGAERLPHASEPQGSPMPSDNLSRRDSDAAVAPPIPAVARFPTPSTSFAWWAELFDRVRTFVLAAWLIGAAALGVRLMSGYWQMTRLRASAIEAEPAALVLCRDLARQMRIDSPAVLRSPFLCSPCLDGLRRPAILLPEDAEASLREVFVHELAHLRRRDGLWNVLRHVASAVLWVQPLLWFLSKKLEETAEQVCDDYVVAFGADRSRYAGHLIELAERRLPPLAPSGVGMISLRSLLARRVVRIMDSTRGLSTRAGKRAIAVTLLVGLAGTLLTGLLVVGSGARQVLGDEPTARRPTRAGETSSTTAGPPQDPARTTVNGRVVDPDGTPVVGAGVIVARYRPAGAGRDDEGGDRQELARGITDARGQFTLNFEDSDQSMSQSPDSPDLWGAPLVVASAAGFGPAWAGARASGSEVSEEKLLRLVRDDIPITARIVDLEGRPVTGAAVRVVKVWQSRTAADFDRWLDAGIHRVPATESTKPRSDHFPYGIELPGNDPAISTVTATDGDGRFRVSGLGRDRLATLAVSGPTIAFRRVQVITHKMNRVPSGQPGVQGVDDPAYHGADGTIVAEPGRPIEGVIRDVDTMAPIAGVVVTAMQTVSISTATDARGRYRLVGLPKANGHMLCVYPSLDRPYFITEFVEVPAAPGLGAIAFDIRLKRGIWITGRVTDVETGQPVQAALHYYPFLANKHAHEYPNFNANSETIDWTGSRYRTDAQGRYRVVGLPGRGIVAARTFDGSYSLGVGAELLPEPTGDQSDGEGGLSTYNRIRPLEFQTVAAIDPPVGTEEFRRDLTVRPGASLIVRLVDPEGKPITNVQVWGRYPAPIDVGDHNLYGQSRTKIVGLDAKVSRLVVFQHRGRKLGAILVVKSADASGGAERTVTLRPCAAATAQVRDADGKPASGSVQIRLTKGEGEGAHETTLFPVRLGADGRFRIDTLIPGATYSLLARDRLAPGISANGRMEPERFKPFALASRLTAESGGVIDLGTFNAATGQRIEEPEHLLAAKIEPGKPARPTVPITGRIVDLEGRPVVGATVEVTQITKPKGDDLNPWIEAVKRGEPGWIAYKHLIYEKPIEPEDKRPRATTDTHGRFRIEGLEADRVVEVAIRGSAISYTSLCVITRPSEPILAKGFPSNYGSEAQRVHGADFTYTAAPGRPVEGVVRDAATRRPLAGVQMVSEHFAGAVMHGIKILKTTTDAQGRFRLIGLPKGNGNALTAIPNDDQPYLLQRVPVPDPAGMAPVQLEVALHQGIWIEGKVTDRASGQPVAGAWLHYLPFLENTFAQATPEFDSNGNGPGATHQDRYQTKPDGTYRLVGLAGRAIVGVVSHSKTPYLQGDGSATIKGMNKSGHFKTWRNPIEPGKLWPTSMKEINPTVATNVVHLDFELNPGAKVRMRVVDREGKPVNGLKLGGRAERGLHEWDSKLESEFDVVTLAADEERTVLIRHEERKLGKIVHVKPGDDKAGPVVVTLEPLATFVGRVTDADGNPVSGATIRTDPLPGGDFSLSLGQVASSDGGQFVVPDVPIGCEYNLMVDSRITARERHFAFAEKKAVLPGETTDVGEIQFKRD